MRQSADWFEIVRDNFTKITREKLAHLAGYRCSKPDCGVVTRGASADGNGTIDVGVAAHITAASPEGPRYDPSLTREQRKAVSNGIWLCQTHGRLVDSDESNFTVGVLHLWKELTAQRSFQEVDASKKSPHLAVLANDADLQTTFNLLLDYSKADLASFQRLSAGPAHPIPLNLRMLDGDRTSTFTVSKLALGIEIYEQLAVVAAPGTGKTTTLLQLAEATLANATSVPVFIPLAEWSTGSERLFQSLLRRAAFREASERQFELLAQHGVLVLILDGWNEIDEPSRRRVRSDLKALRRDFPDIHVVISSRHRDFAIPIDGPLVNVELLTQEQQLELAKSLPGSKGESVLDHAWRTPGLRDLVAIPLYLTALLEQAPEGSLSTTKEEVLRSFVEELERDKDKLATLRQALQRLHRNFLEGLAVEATRQRTVALSEEQARATVDTVQKKLKAEQQIAELFQPMKILDALVDAHMLICSGTESGSVSFQHQQFQEWFASFRVQQLMLSASQGEDEAKKLLREEILDIPVWEEAILFACDRLSRTDDNGINAVAWTILETLEIDPLLSAEMIWRSSDGVWNEISSRVVAFAKKWHKPGHVDRAVKFMIDTGHAEFSELVWPLISDPDSQMHLRALRAGRRFRPGVLGPNARQQIAELPEQVRQEIISEIASNGDMDGIELATSLAKDDTSSKIKISTVESLLFRRADRFVKEILEAAPDEVWQFLAQKWPPNEFRDLEVSARIHDEAAEFDAKQRNPVLTLNRILATNFHDDQREREVRELIERIDFGRQERNGRWLIHRAYELYPKEVVAGLLTSLQHGKEMPFRANEMLRMSDVLIDKGPLADCVREHTGDGRAAQNAVGVVGPKTLGNLIDQLFEVHVRIEESGRYDKELSEEYLRLLGLLSSSKLIPFTEAVLQRANTESAEEIAMLADLISRHGEGVNRAPLILPPEIHQSLTTAVHRWALALLAEPKATRAQFAEIARAAERLQSSELVPVLLELLSEDLTRRKREREEWLEAQNQGRLIQNDFRTSWTLQYQRSFAAIGDQKTIDAMKGYLRVPEFGFEAAHVLLAVWRGAQPPESESGFLRSSPDFSKVPWAYEKRQSSTTEETPEFFDDIVAAINDLIKPNAPEADLLHALKLATVAFSMPYHDKHDTIDSLLKLPVPAIHKQVLLTVLALSGQVICSELVLRGIDDLLEQTAENPWMLEEQDGWRLKEWLRLLPFTEMPGAVLDVLDRASSFRADPWNLRSLLSALAYAPSAEAEAVLETLAKRDERFLAEYDWLAAVTHRNTISAARLLLDLICNISSSESQVRLDRTTLGRNVATLMVAHDEFRNEVYNRYQALEDGPAKSILEYGIAEATNTEGVLLLIRQGAASNKSFQSTGLPIALRNMLVGHSPMEFPGGMQYLYSVPAPDLRKGLFDVVRSGTSSESQLAADCLKAIDDIRDEYGHVDEEPRHPDIATGLPWPLLHLD